MSAQVAIVPSRILRRWDALAAAQLCEDASRQADEIDRLRSDLSTRREELQRADDCIEFWREQALDMQMQLCTQTGGQPGITQDCRLLVVDQVAQP